MVDRLASPEELQVLQALSRENNSASSVPLTKQGQPVVSVLKAAIDSKPHYALLDNNSRERIATAAYASYGILSRSLIVFGEWWAKGMPRIQPPPSLIGLDFRPELTQSLPDADKSYESPVAVAEGLLTLVEGIDANAPLYSPYLQTLKLDGQLQVTSYIRKLQGELRTDIDAAKEGRSKRNLEVTQQRLGVIINTTTQVQKLPTSIPFTTDLADYDSGNTDMGLSSTATHGEVARILASYKGFLLIDSDDYKGWVHGKDIAILPDEVNPQGLGTRFYTGNSPIQIQDEYHAYHLVLPGDKLLSRDDRLYVFSHGENESASLVQLRDTHNFDVAAHRLTPNQMLTQFSGNTLPYMWSHNDCASWLRKTFRMAGIAIPKYSAGIMQILESRLGKEERTLENLSHGLYVIGKPGHVYLAAVDKQGDFRAYSMAFQFTRSDGTVAMTPVGMSELTADQVQEYKRPTHELTTVRLTQ